MYKKGQGEGKVLNRTPRENFQKLVIKNAIKPRNTEPPLELFTTLYTPYPEFLEKYPKRFP